MIGAKCYLSDRESSKNKTELLLLPNTKLKLKNTTFLHQMLIPVKLGKANPPSANQLVAINGKTTESHHLKKQQIRMGRVR